MRAYGQRDPLNEYKRESFELFASMRERYEDTAIKHLFRVEPVSEEEMAERRRDAERRLKERLRLSAPAKSSRPVQQRTVKRTTPKVGRNDPCPCGSGKKYKKCCGAPKHQIA